ncbi:MAG: hypothetical protein LKF43_10640 [Streptococcaceae bacterium]|nr:hypothetical protein [Streptococcaceae bacterium]
MPSFEKELTSDFSNFAGQLETLDYLTVRDTRLIKGNWRLKANATQLDQGLISLGINDFRIKTSKKTATGLTLDKINAKSNTSIFQTHGALLDVKADDAPNDYELTLGAEDFKGVLSRAGWTDVQNGTYTGTITYTLEDGLWEEPIDPLPITDKNGTPEVTDAGDEVTLANAQWRILKVDDNKALVIKVNALTEAEAGFSGLGSSSVAGTPYLDNGNLRVPFLSSTAVGQLDAGSISGKRGYYYFDSDGSNGYENSGATSYTSNDDVKYKYGLKGAIDYYYNSTIAPSYSNYVLSVNLNNPDLSTFNSKNTLNWSYNSGSWGVWYQDTDFETIYGSGTKQAFALSYGDINTTMGLSGSSSSTLLSFGSPNYFWLRSAGGYCDYAGSVYIGDFYYNSNVSYSLPVRPALWISLGS